MVIAIPAAADQEADNIYHTLSQYLGQTDYEGTLIDPNRFEIVICANYTEFSDIDKVGKFLEEVARFKNDHASQIRVTCVSIGLPKQELTIGKIRKFLSDLILLRSKRAGVESDLIMASNDADATAVSKLYVDSLVGLFRKKESSLIGGIMGKLDWDPRLMQASPTFLAGIRAFQYLDLAMQYEFAGSRHRNIPSSGCNFSYRASMYAAVGGYDSETRVGEDNRLGDAIYAAREVDADTIIPTIARAPKGATIYTSARRAVIAHMAGYAPAEMWNEEAATPFSTTGDRVREATPEQLAKMLSDKDKPMVEGIAHEDDESIKLFDRSMEDVLTKTFAVYEVLDRPDIVAKVMRGLSISGSIDPLTRRLVITESKQFRSAYLEAVKSGYAEEILKRNIAS
jgi:hypothetical protein